MSQLDGRNRLTRRLGSESPLSEGGSRLRFSVEDNLDVLRDDWNGLAECSRNIFATWEWVSSWWQHFGRGRIQCVTGRAVDGRLVGLLPLCVSRSGPFRFLRFLGHGVADISGPICATIEEGLPLFDVLDDIPQWDIFVGENLPRDQNWSQMVGATVLADRPSAVLRFGGGTWSEFLASRSPNFRQQVGRLARRLSRAHSVSFRLTEDSTRLDQDLTTLFELHRARWGTSGGSFGGREVFHRDFAAQAFKQGWLRLWFLEVDGRAVAAWYGHRFCGVETYYQAGRDSDWDDYRVGSVLLAHTIKSAIEDGMTEYRFLRGGEKFKYRWASADPGIETICLSRGIRGAAALATSRALARSSTLRAAVGRPWQVRVNAGSKNQEPRSEA